ncbi:MAG: hypothetical protein AB1656_21095 [Candidatus Omnitrophota bacterium]
MTRKFIYSFIFLFSFVGLAEADKAPFDRIVPANILFYMENNPASPQGPSFPKYEEAFSKFLETMDDFLEWRVLKAEWQTLREQMQIVQNGEKLFGGQWIFALSGLDDSVKLPAAIFMARLEKPEETDKAIAQTFKSLTDMFPMLQVEQDEYSGYPIRFLYGPGRIPGMGLAYAYDDASLYACTSKPKLIKLLDNIEFQEKCLAEDESYKTVVSHLPSERSSTMYWNLAQLTQPLKSITSAMLGTLNLIPQNDETPKNIGEAIEKNGGDAPKELIDVLRSIPISIPDLREAKEAVTVVDAILSYLTSVQAIGFSTVYDENGNKKTTSYSLLSSNWKDTSWSKVFDRPPAVFSFEDYMVRNTGSLSSGNVFGPKDLWNTVHALIEPIPFLKEPIETAEKYLADRGISLEEDVFSWMGDEWCIMRPVMDLESVMPMNNAALLVRTQDAAKAAAGLQKIQEGLIGSFGDFLICSKETYQNTPISTLQLKLPFIPITPSWCVHENAFILTSSSQLLKEMLDVKNQSASGILRNRYYKVLRDSVMRPANKVSFQDNEAEFYAYREGVRRAASLASLGKGESEDEKALPLMILDRASYLLTIFQALKGTANRTTFGGQEIRSDKTQLIQDLRLVPDTEAVFRYKISLGGEKLIAELAEQCAKRNDIARAARLYSAICDFFPNNGKYLSRLADLYRRNNDPESAMKVYDRAFAAAPETALLIGRELLRKDAGAQEIIGNIKAAASETQRIDEKTALFGVALGKRDAGDQSNALALFQDIDNRFSPNSQAQAARNEAALIQGQNPGNAIRLAIALTPPAIDGIMEESWNNAEVWPLVGAPEDWKGEIRLMKDARNLYVLFLGENPVHPDAIEKETFQVMIDPRRDYTHESVWTVVLQQDGDDWKVEKSREQKIVDPLGMTLKIKDGGDKKALFNIIEVQNRQENLETGWQFAFTRDNNSWYAEMEIPFEQIDRENQSKIWLFNAVREAISEGESRNQALTKADDPFSCLMLRLD